MINNDAHKADVDGAIGAGTDLQLPRISLAALFMPAIWGPAHGQWITILFYPLWLFADTTFCNAIVYGGLAIVLAITVFVGTAAITVFYAMTCGLPAYKRVQQRQSIQRYLRQEHIWLAACLIIAIALIVLATWYNLEVRLPDMFLQSALAID